MQMKEQVGVYVGELLKPRFKSNAISKEDYKWVVRKTVEKVTWPQQRNTVPQLKWKRHGGFDVWEDTFTGT